MRKRKRETGGIDILLSFLYSLSISSFIFSSNFNIFYLKNRVVSAA
ncbi:hypothetical protein [Cetobacterium sp.]